MMFWQLTIDAADPARLARFWGRALGWQSVPPEEPDTTWWRHYRGRGTDFTDRLFDSEGLRPPIWFQQVPEAKSGKNRLHLDLYPAGRDDSLPFERSLALMDGLVGELVALGATVAHREVAHDFGYVVMLDPEGNEFCVGA